MATVVASKFSFGSQSEAGAKSKDAIMTLLHTVKKKFKDQSLEEWLTDALNKISKYLNIQISKKPKIKIATLIPQ